MYATLEEGVLIVLATAEVPEAKEAAPGTVEKAVLKIEKTLKGDATLKQVEITFQRGMDSFGMLVPTQGQRCVWVLTKIPEKEKTHAMPNVNGLLKADDDTLKIIARIVELQQRVKDGKPPAEDEIRKLAADPNGHIAVFGVHLMATLEPARFADFAATAIEKKNAYLCELLIALPQEKSVPLLLTAISRDSGNYMVNPSFGAPLQILQLVLKKAAPPEELRKRICTVLAERYRKDGEAMRDNIENGIGDPLIAALALVADKDHLPVLQSALVFGATPGRQGTVDPAAADALWKLQGAEALPLLRKHLLSSTGPIQRILGEHGDASDFPRLLYCAEKEPGRCGTDAIGALKRLVERAALPIEPWMSVREVGSGGLKHLDLWKAWWTKNEKTFKLK